MTDEKKDLSVPETAAGKRLDLFVGEQLTLSRAQLRKLFDEDRVRVEGRKAKKGQPLAAGQQISVRLEVVEDTGLVPQPDAPLVILAEDASLLAIDKPAGAPSHPLRPGETGTVANALVARFPECEAASEDPREGGLCHRLDIETSGVLIAARSRAVWERVRATFEKRDVDKRYWALVTGPIADEGEIELPLRHHPRHADRVEPDPMGAPGSREAISSFQVLARAGDRSLVEVKIVTGVLHQVRAHLSAIGAPIVGDALYGGRAEPTLGRFFLHARAIRLPHPDTGKPFRVESPLPPALEQALGRAGITLGAPAPAAG